jgi:excisionase family DNA binding protein
MTRYLDTNQLAEHLQLHPETIRRLAREKAIPAIRVCGHLRFDPAQIEKSLAREAAASQMAELLQQIGDR